MNILLTGGNGFIGAHLARALLRRGHAVSLLVRDPAKRTESSLDLPEFPADLRNYAQTARAVRRARPDVVVHLAARGATEPFLAVDEALRNNVHGTIHLLRACFERGAGVRQAVVVRTAGERDCHNPYAASKAAAWRFCQMYAGMSGWPIVGAMVFQAYGPGQPASALVPAAIKAAQSDEDFPLTTGQQRRDWTYVLDVVDGLARIAERALEPGSTLELGSGEAISVLDVARQIYALVGGRGQPRPGELSDRPHEAAEQVARADVTARLLGWRASTSLEHGLGLLLEHAGTGPMA